MFSKVREILFLILAKSKLRSSLASLESLDSFLIPAILSHSQVHSKLLQNHWNDEIAVLINSIQNIIDTQAFCGCMIDILSNSINSLSQTYDEDISDNLIYHCDALHQHFQLNFDELNLGAESSRKFYYDDFVLMLKECKAALVLCKKDENHRIIKRLKILLSVLKKFHGSLKTDDESKHDKVLTFGEVTLPPSKFSTKIKLVKTESMEVLTSESVTTEIFFKSMGITASPTNIFLYESKREKSSSLRERSTQINFSTFNMKRSESNTSILTPTRNLKRS